MDLIIILIIINTYLCILYSLHCIHPLTLTPACNTSVPNRWYHPSYAYQRWLRRCVQQIEIAQLLGNHASCDLLRPIRVKLPATTEFRLPLERNVSTTIHNRDFVLETLNYG